MTPLDKALGDSMNWPHKTIEGDYVAKGPFGWQTFSPSTNWAQLGPLIEKYSVSLVSKRNGQFISTRVSGGVVSKGVGDTPLIAVCKCIIELEEEQHEPE